MGNLLNQNSKPMKYAVLIALVGQSQAAKVMSKDSMELAEIAEADVPEYDSMELAQAEAAAGDVADYDHKSYQYPVQEQNFNGILGMLGTPTSMTDALHMQFNQIHFNERVMREIRKVVEDTPELIETLCAQDGDVCECPGDNNILYGAITDEGKVDYMLGFAQDISDNSGKTKCSSDVFGDPVPDMDKYCWCQTWDSEYTYGGVSSKPKHKSDEIDGGDWEMVRHQPKGSKWGPATDQLAGTDVYGNPDDDSKPWSVKFADKDFEEFLFATGDMKKWAVMEKDVVLGWYANQQRKIEHSSLNANGHTAAMYRRKPNKEDPWISLVNHHTAIGSSQMMYGENNFGGAHASILKKHQGADVYI